MISYFSPVVTVITLAAGAVPLWLLARRFTRAGRIEVWLVSALFPVMDVIARVAAPVAAVASEGSVVLNNEHILAWFVLAIGWRWWRTRPATVARVGTQLSPAQSLAPALVTGGGLALALTGLGAIIAPLQLIFIIVGGLLSMLSTGTKQVATDQRVTEPEIAVPRPRQPSPMPQHRVEESPPLRSSDTPARPVEKTARIFISYRRDDSADVAGRIYDRLTARYGKAQVFKDVDSIPLGVDFRDYLHRRVASCDILLAVVGPHWHAAEGKRRLDDNKDFVRIELEAALQRQIPVIPVLVRGAQVPEESDLPASISALAYRNGINVRPDPDFHHDMDRLIEGVEGHLREAAG